MVDKKDYIRVWQNRVGRSTCHLDLSDMSENQISKLHNQYNLITSMCNLEGKKILDYGCGGGLLGAFLSYQEIKIKKYIGLDVAPRCIVASEDNNLNWIETGIAEFELVNPNIMPDLKNYKASVLIVLNVIPYLPTMIYVESFLRNINRSGIKEIIIHTRKGNNKFKEKPYRSTKDVGQACYLNINTVVELLDKYDRKKIVNKNSDCYIYLSKKVKKKRKKDFDEELAKEEIKKVDKIIAKGIEKEAANDKHILD